MAPTVSEITEKRRPFSLEEYLHTCLRIKDGLRTNGRHTGKTTKLGQSKGCKGRMVLVVDESSREADSPSLPPSSPVQPHLANSAAVSSSSHLGYSCSSLVDKKQELIEISLKTMALLRRNQQLQRRLTALQIETRAFVKAALNEAGNRNGGGQAAFNKPSK